MQMESCPKQRFENIYDLYHSSVHRYLARRTGNESDAADITQETFVRLYEKDVKPETARAWLFKTGYHLFVDQWRKSRRAVHLPIESIAEWPDPQTTSDMSPEKNALESELRTEIRKALAMLTPRDRTALLLLAQSGLTYREIAERIGCTETAVKTLVHRARKRMRELLEAR